MPIGRPNPCPVALGGDAETGWTAAQQSRVAADVVALVRTMPFAWITVTQTATTVTVDTYESQSGNGSEHAPTPLRVAAGRTQLTWPASVQDAYGKRSPVHIRAAKGSFAHTSAAHGVTFALNTPTVIEVATRDGAGTLTDGTWSAAFW